MNHLSKNDLMALNIRAGYGGNVILLHEEFMALYHMALQMLDHGLDTRELGGVRSVPADA